MYRNQWQALFGIQAMAFWSSLYIGVLVTWSCPTLCHPTDGSPLGSAVLGILQAKILEWVALLFSRGSSQPRDWTWVSWITGRFLTIWATLMAFKIRCAHFWGVKECGDRKTIHWRANNHNMIFLHFSTFHFCML